MTQAVVDRFVMPLSACFTPRAGQDFELFAKQLIEDLKPYSPSVLDEAVGVIRRGHRTATWPTIAQCLEVVQAAAQRQYRPPEKQPEPQRNFVSPARIASALRLDPGGGMLTDTEMRACPVGTQYWAEDATIRYPNGSVETWGDFRRRRRQERQDQAA